MSEAQWMVQTKRADFDAIAERFGIDKVTARILTNRGITGEEAISRFLDSDISRLYDPLLMKDMDKAVQIIKQAASDDEKIRVVGDYDIDGVCSVTILCTALLELGIDADYDIPDRRSDGYGINKRIVDAALDDGVNVIITCDNGIAAGEVVSYAKEKGITVIVTDHHEIPYELDGENKKYKLPPADAVVDHKRVDCDYPYKELCGAGIAFKLACALGVCEETKRQLLKLAAFATIGDVVELHDENRIIVKNGLEAINESEGGFLPPSDYDYRIEGLAELIRKTGLSDKEIKSYHIGFVLGPCVNAAGRLASAKTAAELFLGEGDTESLAMRLKEYNDERKSMTERMTRLAADMAKEEASDNVLVLYLPDCHEAVAGIVAGRIKEQFYKPCFVITDSDEPDIVKGSARSIDGYHIYDELSKCAGLLTKFGGHAMAGGFSLDRTNIDELRSCLNENESLTVEQLIPKVWIDVPMPMSYVSMTLTDELDKLEPFGTGNEKPLFADRNLTVANRQILGESGNVVKLMLKDPSGNSFTGIMFRNSEGVPVPGEGQVISVLYYPQINEFRGNKSLQFVIQDFR